MKPDWTGLPSKAGRDPESACLQHIERTGYLQLDSIPVTGARAHGILLASRLSGLDRHLPEQLLRPEGRVFEYWGHEASWMPLALYPAFAWRREGFRDRTWYKRHMDGNADKADALLARIRDEGPLRSADLEGESRGGWWGHKLSKKLAECLWSSGELAIRERNRFIRSYDLAERVIPDAYRTALPYAEALETLLLKALDGHGWASERTLAATWRIRDRPTIRAALDRLEERGQVIRCALTQAGVKPRPGWIRPRDLDLADRADKLRPRRDRGVLLSPFDPVLWDRDRVKRLFDFDLKIEIYVPAARRRWGYYCLPVLAGDALVGRVDLKAHRKEGRLEVKARHLEAGAPSSAVAATDHAIARFAEAVELTG